MSFVVVVVVAAVVIIVIFFYIWMGCDDGDKIGDGGGIVVMIDMVVVDLVNSLFLC